MKQENQLLLSTCLLAGRIMMESGSEAYRVEDTMQRIALNTNQYDTESYVTATGIFISLNNESGTQVCLVHKRSVNLEKIDATNQLSRQYADGQITLPELYEKLKIVDKETPEFSKKYQIIAAGVASFSLMILLGGNYSDIPLAFIIGSIGYWVSFSLYAKFQMKFINDFFASLTISFLALLASHFIEGINIDSLIIGCVMPLVPGLAITAAIRDLFEGHLVTGVTRSVEALLTLGVIGISIALVLQWFA